MHWINQKENFDSIQLTEVGELVELLKRGIIISNKLQIILQDAGKQSQLLVPIKDNGGKVVQAKLTNPASVFSGARQLVEQLQTAKKLAEDGLLETLSNSHSAAMR